MPPQLPPFVRARVLVVGDVMLDRYCRGSAARISPEAPVPVVQVDSVSDRPGGAANVALNIAALGAAVSLRGCSGADEAGDSLQAMLEAAGVECHLRRLAGRSTVIKLRVIARQQQLLRLDFESSSPPAEAALAAAEVARGLPGCGALVLSDYAKGALAEPQALIAAARARAVPVVVDPKGPDFHRYRGASLLTPNLGEFEAAVGRCADEAELLARGAQLIDSLELDALLLTRGEQGMTLLQRGAAAQHLPARAREVFDVTGAGDTVIAILATALAAGAPLPQAVALANCGAGLAVGRLGAAAISAPELRRAMRGGRPPGRGVVALEQLQTALAAARACGERIVFTNGCFDLLHAGHVACLEQARALGDRLVVAVNSDASVRRLKGAGRPLNPLERRMAVLAGLEAVDWVLPFAGDTPCELLRSLRPEVLVKGGDYRRKEDVVGWDIVEAYGGEVRLTGALAGASTTDLAAGMRGEK